MARANEKTRQLLEKINRLEETEKNYLALKSRWRRDVFKSKEEGVSQTVSALSPIVDDIERALDLARENNQPDLERSLISLKKATIYRFKGVGAIPFADVGDLFDPHLHDAISSEAGEEGVILRVHSLGWLDQSGNLLVPAQVTVGRKS